MVKTLNEDGFDEGEHGQAMDDSTYIVIYGPDGWTDALNEYTVAHLVGIGALVLVKDVKDSNTRFYKSVGA